MQASDLLDRGDAKRDPRRLRAAVRFLPPPLKNPNAGGQLLKTPSPAPEAAQPRAVIGSPVASGTHVGYTSVMAKQTGPDLIFHVLERVEAVEQSASALEKGLTEAVMALGKQVETTTAAFRRDVASMAKAVRSLAEHEAQQDKALKEHDARLRKLEDLLGA